MWLVAAQHKKPYRSPSTQHRAPAPSSSITAAPSRSSTQHPAPSTSNYRTVLVENGVSCLQRGVPPLPVKSHAGISVILVLQFVFVAALEARVDGGGRREG